MKYWIMLGFLLLNVAAFADDPDDTIDNSTTGGETIRITTRLNSYVGKPSWLLVIRDVDHSRTIPYVFDFQRGENTWLAYTFGHHYLITISNLQMPTYIASHNDYKNYQINDFCHLQSNGRVQNGVGMDITITGDLNAKHHYQCQAIRYPSN